MTGLAERHDTYVAQFEAFRRDPSFGPDEVGRRREHAFARFLAKGFPSTRDEDWRFTNIAPIAAGPFVRAAPVAASRADIAPFLFDGIGPEIVLINGRVSRALSALERLPAGVSIHTLAEPADSTGRRLSDRHNGDRRLVSGPFVDLNEAFYEDLVVIRVEAKAIVADPIHVLSLTIADGTPALVLPRTSIQVGRGAQASFVESYAGLGPANTLTSAVTVLDLEPDAVATHVRIQRETDAAFHMGSLGVWLDRSSTFTSQALTFGGRIARNDITAVLGGEGAECTLNGLYVATGESLVDTHTTIDHAKPHCPSHEVYKGILGGRARAVFNGKIIVRPDAQKTDAKQTNRALLLTDDAQVNTKPQLEIFADDVKCTHGAAIGQLDEDALFYLRARGIDERAARIMLIHAFAGQVLDGIGSDVVRSAAMQLVDRKLSIA
jgi:Fe-S cluster assembly protein SufD